MENTGLSRRDTTKGAPLRVLALDGGGVRGYSMLIQLQELMHRTYVEIHGTAPKRHEIPKPCDHFDLIAGTGTGGLIAIMLGRLRLDLDTCKDVYVRMTKKVFETDKTIAGIPYRSTLFKASKLEQAIKECVREHTVFDDEGNDSLAMAQPITPAMRSNTTMTSRTSSNQPSNQPSPRRTLSNASQISGLSIYPSLTTAGPGHWGNPEALLYDVRDNRTKTAVTAVYRGASKNIPPALLRSYDSRKEPAPEYNCTIWEAGRATCATGLAFKPIAIGQSVFIDEGMGRFNPSPQIMDEALVNEWPGREIGVFISIGTGRRPSNSSSNDPQWWEGFMGGPMSNFAEARRKLIAKIEGCEETHQYMLREHLTKRGVNSSNYYRFNVEVGVGEFGMNEWNRLSDISSNTRMYLSKPEIQALMHDSASKMGRIQRVMMRFERSGINTDRPMSWEESFPNEIPPPSNPMAVELPAEPVLHGYPQRPNTQPHQYMQQASADDKFAVLQSTERPGSSSAGKTSPRQHHLQPHTSSPRRSTDQHSQISSIDHATEPPSQPPPPPPPPPSLPSHPHPHPHPHSNPQQQQQPPPIPPKTPLNTSIPLRTNTTQTVTSPQSSHYSTPQSTHFPPRKNGPPLPYPEDPPPVVNMANKPQLPQLPPR